MVLSKSSGFETAGLYSPPAVGGLRQATVLGDGRGNLTSVVAFPRSGTCVLVFPHATGSTFGPPEIVTPPTPNSLPTGQSTGSCVIRTDIDGDTDQDVVVPLGDQRHWVALRNRELDLTPNRVSVTDHGKADENGFKKYDLVLQVPEEAIQLGLDEVELAVFIDDITIVPSRHAYWGRLIGTVDPLGSSSFVPSPIAMTTPALALPRSWPAGCGASVPSASMRCAPTRPEATRLCSSGGDEAWDATVARSSGGRLLAGVRDRPGPRERLWPSERHRPHGGVRRGRARRRAESARAPPGLARRDPGRSADRPRPAARHSVRGPGSTRSRTEHARRTGDRSRRRVAR